MSISISMNESCDVLVIGAGPTGMACAIECQRAGATTMLVEKGCVVNSIYHYPANMVFFTTPEKLVIGDIPFTTAHEKPTRLEALEYYRNVTEHYRLPLRQYEKVTKVVQGQNGGFAMSSVNSYGLESLYHARKVVVATGYYDLPNLMGIPGEDLPKVMHYYGEPHPYYDCDVAIIGAKNSAAIAALELWRRGARVTLIHRGPKISSSVKYWIKPDIENRIANGEITAYFNSTVEEISSTSILVVTSTESKTIRNDFVFALTGYHPDFEFLKQVGVEISSHECRPVCNPETLESNVPGIYLAGVIVAGSRTSEIFIENGRFHGARIAADINLKLRAEKCDFD